MDLLEEERINRLILSVEREEIRQVIERPRGAFIAELFPEENIQHDESEGVAVLPIDEEHSEDEDDLQENPQDEDHNIEYDSELDNMPLHTRLHNDIVPLSDGRLAYLNKKRDFLWNANPTTQRRTRERNIIRMRVGCPTEVSKRATTPYEVWNLFFTDDMVNSITHNTNIWINKNKDNYSRESDAKETTPVEMKAVFGLLYLAGVFKASHANVEDLWTDDGMGIDYFRCTMSIKRFKFLLRAIRFDDLNTRTERRMLDYLAPVREIFEQFVQNCKNNYNVSEFVTIDEMLDSFRGRCRFRVYMKNKPAKYGLKIYAMVCAKTFYTSNLEVYTGKQQPLGPFSVDNSSKSAVTRLIQPISGSARNVTVDNFFCSIPLCCDLLADHRLTLVGTLRKNKAEIPALFLDTKQRKVGSSVFGFRKQCTIVSYKAKKNKEVLLLSSMHDDDHTDLNLDSPTYTKPEIILFYNSSKGGVDVVDKYKETYSTARTCNRWSMRIFYSMMDIGAINAFVILKKNLKEENMLRRRFLQDLAKNLTAEHMHSRISIKNIPRHIKQLMCKILKIREGRTQQPPPADDVNQARCYMCTWKQNRLSKTRCSSCNFFICREHSAPAKCATCAEDMDISDDEDMDMD